jgi:hypothetical protein
LAINPPPPPPPPVVSPGQARQIRDKIRDMFGVPRKPVTPSLPTPPSPGDIDYPYGFPPSDWPGGLSPDDPDFPLPPWYPGAPTILNQWNT